MQGLNFIVNRSLKKNQAFLEPFKNLGTILGTKKISMLNITFKFHNYKRKDGNYQLLIRLRCSDQEKVIPTEIHIDKSKWDNSNKMVRSDHIAAQP